MVVCHTFLFNINYLARSIRPRDRKHVLLLWIRVDLEVMALKEYSSEL